MLNECPFTAATMFGLITRISGRLVFPKVGSFNLEHELGGRRSCRLILENPGWTPTEGETLDVRWHNDLLFAGTLHERQKTVDPSHALTRYECEALGWEYCLEHRLLSASYENQAAGPILDDVVAKHLVSEGILRGTFQTGPTLVLARADQLQIAQFLRDVAEGAGGVVLVDPGKLLSFYQNSLPAAPFTLDEASIQTIEDTSDREDYRNRATIRVRGTGGTTVEVTRDNPAEIAIRQTTEGGSGLYERFEIIEHPTSNDPLQLQRLGIGYALIRLNVAGQSRRSLRAHTRRHHLQVGQALPVNLPASELSGTWVIQRLRIFETDGERLRYELEAVQSNAANVALEGLLRIVQAGRATIQLPGSLFANLVPFSTVGTFEYVVQGTGTVELELTTIGAGGGGAGARSPTPAPDFAQGGYGGAGGKAVRFVSLPAGTILTVTVGAPGVAGAGCPTPASQTDGTAGGLSKVEQGASVLVQANGGGGGIADPDFGNTSGRGPDGAPGSGQGDLVTVGGGAPGGIGGEHFSSAFAGDVWCRVPTDGGIGRVEIRF
jgi:hypothetical protein